MKTNTNKAEILRLMDDELKEHGLTRANFSLRNLQELYSEIAERKQGYMDILDGFWFWNEPHIHFVDQQDGYRVDDTSIETNITYSNEEYHIEVNDQRQYVGDGETVQEAVESLFANIYADELQHGNEPSWETPVMRFVLDDSVLPFYEKTETIDLYLRALNIMVETQCGQRDKNDLSYYYHPVRVSASCPTDKTKIAALLHDVIEDTFLTSKELLDMGFPEDIIEGVLSVTKQEGEEYTDFIVRASKNPIGKEVKIADLRDNMDITRLERLTDEDFRRLRKYLYSWRFLTGLEEHISLKQEKLSPPKRFEVRCHEAGDDSDYSCEFFDTRQEAQAYVNDQPADDCLYEHLYIVEHKKIK